MSARLISRHETAPADYTVKYVIVGEVAVGKSSILDVLSGESFITNREPTVGIEFFMLRGVGDPVKPLAALLPEAHDPQVHPTHYKLQVWDCAGQIRFRSIVKSYFRGAHVVLVVFDVMDRNSFETVKEWVNNVRHEFLEDTDVVIGLLGNKSDLRPREVSDQEAIRLVNELKLDFYFPVSAANNTNLDTSLSKALELVHHKVLTGGLKLQHRDYLERQRGGTVKLSDVRPPRDPKCSDCF